MTVLGFLKIHVCLLDHFGKLATKHFCQLLVSHISCHKKRAKLKRHAQVTYHFVQRFASGENINLWMLWIVSKLDAWKVKMYISWQAWINSSHYMSMPVSVFRAPRCYVFYFYITSKGTTAVTEETLLQQVHGYIMLYTGLLLWLIHTPDYLVQHTSWHQITWWLLFYYYYDTRYHVQITAKNKLTH